MKPDLYTLFRDALISRFGADRGYLTRAAKTLGYNYSYIANMANGYSPVSKTIMRRLEELPAHKEPLRHIYEEALLGRASLREAIQSYRQENGLKTFHDAVIDLVIKGIESANARTIGDSATPGNPKAPKTPEDPFS